MSPRPQPLRHRVTRAVLSCSRFYRRFEGLATVNLLTASAEYRSLSQDFVLKYRETEARKPSLTPDEVFEETVETMRAKGMLPAKARSEAHESRGKQSQVDVSKIMK